jgi:hypothetical protein
MSRSLFQMAVAVASLALAAEAAHAGSFQQQVAAAPRGEVDVSNISGTIAVSGWDRPAVSVTADLPSDTERVKVTTEKGRTSVCVIYNHSDSCNSPGGFGEGGGAVRLELHVPRGSELDVSAVNADIRSDGVSGTQRLHTVNGDIDAELGSGTDEVTSVSGAIVLRGSGQDGALHVTSVSGNLSVTNVAGELEARTVNGTLIAGVTTARLVRLDTTSGDIRLSGQLSRGGTVETASVSGEEQISLSAPAGYAYEAKTFSGDIRDCFGQQSERSEFGPGDSLDGTRGAGDGHVRMQSLSGNISLCDH